MITESHSDPLFHLEAGPYRDGELRVVSFRGREAISRPYRWDVLVDAPNEPAAFMETALLAQPACLDLSLEGSASRVEHGVIAALRRTDVSNDGARIRMVLRLVPRLWLLSRNRLSRVFQDMTALEIVRELLDEAGVAWESRVQHPKPRRVYCVQYQESSLAFIQRILAEEGVFYFFEQPSFSLTELPGATAAGALFRGLLSERLVLADGTAGIQGIDAGEHVHGLPTAFRSPALVMHPPDGDIAEEYHVTRFSRARTVRAQAVVLRDYDFRRPSAQLAASQTVAPVLPDPDEEDDGFTDSLRSNIEGAGRISLVPMAPIVMDPLLATVFEHHGEHEDPDVNRQTAQSRLEQLRGRAETAEGGSYCRRLSPGHRFTLDLHRDSALDGEYAVTDVVHHGGTGTDANGRVVPSYHNTFEAIPGHAAPRPPRPRRIHQQVIETARVVGPAGEEIYTDTHGRIKVRFHWDLDGPTDGRSSCWIRPSQAWSGNGWGTQFIPRVGMEVLVGFVGGDKDRPVVLGCVYNGENAPPFVLPGDKTRSGIRTQSSPGGSGFNELSFEDAAGEEQIYLFAQRNLDEHTRRDRSAYVGQDDSTTVARHQSLSVVGNRKEAVHGDRELHVHGERRETTDGAIDATTRGPEHRWNLDRVEHRVEGRAKYVHTSAVDENFEDERTVRAKGCVTTLVGAVDEERHWGLHVEGTSLTYASKGVELDSPEGIVLSSGISHILITPAGISLYAKNISLTCGNTVLTMDAKDISARAEETIILEGQKKARLLAPDISLTKAEALEEAEQPPPPTRILLTDTQGVPLAGKRYRVVQEDGSVRSGFLDATGATTIPGEQGGKVEFPEFDGVPS